MYKLLVVEDDVSINSMLTKLLTDNQYEVQSAFSGTEAVLLLAKDAFDWLFIRMCGIENRLKAS